MHIGLGVPTSSTVASRRGTGCLVLAVWTLPRDFGIRVLWHRAVETGRDNNVGLGRKSWETVCGVWVCGAGQRTGRYIKNKPFLPFFLFPGLSVRSGSVLKE